MLKPTRKPKAKTKLKLINLKVTPEEYLAIKAKAKRHTQGNASEWLRYAATRLSPNRKDIKKVA